MKTSNRKNQEADSGANKVIRIELRNEAVTALQRIGKVTGRGAAEVISDALKTYEWILREQTAEHKVIATDGRPEEQTEMANIVVDREAARTYFSTPSLG